MKNYTEQFEQLKNIIEAIKDRIINEKDFKIFDWNLINNQFSPKIISEDVKTFFNLLMGEEESKLQFETFPEFQWSFCNEKMIVKTTSIFDTDRFIDLLSSIDRKKLQIEKIINFHWNEDLSEITIEIAKEEVPELFEAIFELNKPERDIRKKIKKQPSYSELEESFYSDVIMSVLNDSLSNIVSYFNRKNIGKYSKIYNEIFFSDHEKFKIAVKEYLLKFEIKDSESIIEKIDYFGTEINSKVPKILFPFYVYSLTKSYGHLSISVKKKLEIVNEERLTLKKTESNYPNEIELYKNSQIDFNRFINSLTRIDEYFEEVKCNKSLNLFIFNQFTNLYDLFESVKLFKRSYFYKNIVFTEKIWRQVKVKQKLKQEKSEVPIIFNKKFAKHKHKSKMFEGIGNLSKIDLLSVKSSLVCNLSNSEIFEINDVMELLNLLLNNCKQELLNFIVDEFELNGKGIPEKISLDYAIFRLFSNDEPYEKKINMANKSLEIFEPNEKKFKETHLFEAYVYSYKSFQKTKSHDLKSKLE